MRFEPLSPMHFPLLLRWLQAPHVQRWWGYGVEWTEARVHKKYKTYVEGYKLSNGVSKPIQARVIYENHSPIGYIQVYNPYDFPRKPALVNVPSLLTTFDILIGEEASMGQGLGSKALMRFFDGPHAEYPYETLFVDPDRANGAAIRCYEKVGFEKIADKGDVVWMLKSKRLDKTPGF